MNGTNDIKIGELSLTKFKNQVLGELGYGLGHTYNLGSTCNLRINLYREDKCSSLRVIKIIL